MILRVFRARAKAGHRSTVERMQVELGVPMVAGQPGLVAFYPARPLEKEGNEFAFVTVWKDLASLKAWAGKDWNEAVLPDDEKPFLEGVSVQHYEIPEIARAVRPSRPA